MKDATTYEAHNEKNEPDEGKGDADDQLGVYADPEGAGQYTKAIAAVVGALVTIAATAGIDIDPTITAAVITILTAGAVFFFPNG